MAVHLGGDEWQRKCYRRSLYFSVSPASLVPLAIEMYRKYTEVCPGKLDFLFNYPDKTKVSRCSSLQGDIAFKHEIWFEIAMKVTYCMAGNVGGTYSWRFHQKWSKIILILADFNLAVLLKHHHNSYSVIITHPWNLILRFTHKSASLPNLIPSNICIYINFISIIKVADFAYELHLRMSDLPELDTSFNQVYI